MVKSLSLWLLLALAPAVQAEIVVFDTISPYWHSPPGYRPVGDPPDPGDASYYRAMRFSPSQSGYFSRVEIPVFDVTYEAWSMGVSIFSSHVPGNFPNQSLEDIIFDKPSAGALGTTILSVDASANTWLDASQDYWLVLSPLDLEMLVWWNRTIDPTPGDNKMYTYAAVGFAWIDATFPDLNQGAFRITAVPVPAASWLMLSALGLVTLVRKR